MYAELAAVDRLSFQQISSSNFIRSAKMKQGLPSHTSSTTVGQKVFQYYDEAKVIKIDHLQKKIKENCRFALSFDEYNCFTKHFKQFLQHQLKLSVCFQLVVYS